MGKNKTVSGVLEQLIDKDVPWLMEQIMQDKDLSTDAKATRISMLQTAQHHLKLVKVLYT